MFRNILRQNLTKIYTNTYQIPLFFKNISRRSIFTTEAYAGFLRRGGTALKFCGFWIYMPGKSMSRAAKLRAVAWGRAPQENFLKWCNFVHFEDYFQTHFHDKKSCQKITNKQEIFSLTLL